ncbi:MAG TPA: dolichyl-phosphate beta-glucosyltransferase [Dehalococcoidia bacterium]|nr:dolichyl-phosphate beta-glucosyltransferase [Dehalococcoidia bacterium]
MSLFLSIVIPAYNEEGRILPSLERIDAYLAGQDYPAEVLVSDDGSRDETTKVVEVFAADHPNVRLIRNPHRGKGAAVRAGMLAARGDYRFLCDADLSMPIEEVSRFLPPALTDADVALGSREAAGARRYDEPIHRHLMGRIFNTVVRLVAVGGFNDTQAGFKCFRAEAAEWLFSRQRIDGFGFDVEVVYLAVKRGYRVVEVPINWYHVPSSRVDPLRDSIRMFFEAFSVRLNDRRGLYR